RKSARPCGDRCRRRQEGRQNATAAGSSNFGESEGGQEPLLPTTSLRLSASKPTARTSHDYTHLSSENGLFNRKGRFCFLAGSRKPEAGSRLLVTLLPLLFALGLAFGHDGLM